MHAIELYRCAVCKVEFLFPQPSWEAIRQGYTADYFKAWGMESGERPEVAVIKKATFSGLLDLISGYVANGRLLDLGTASGFLLEVARERGFEPWGVELSQYAAGLATKKFGESRIHCGTLENAPFEPESFDVITMCDFIEHVVSPLDTLARARQLLKPDGILVIVTPDTFSLTHRLMQKRWPHYKLEHLFYFNPLALRKAAAATAFNWRYCARARKTLTLNYVHSQAKQYPNLLLTPLVNGLWFLGGQRLREYPARVTIGELVAILQKPSRA